jgi:hypothetical protein
MILGKDRGSCEAALKGRTHDYKRPVLLTKKTLGSWRPSTHEAALVAAVRLWDRSVGLTAPSARRLFSEPPPCLRHFD